MKVLVTGAAGFIGRNVCKALRASGFEVIGLVRSLPPEADRVADVFYVIGDVRVASPPDESSPYIGCDAVVHLIGIITEIRGKGQTFDAIHVQGTRNVTLAAQRADIRRFVYLSALGASAQSASAYARSKAQAETIVNESNLTATIFRPSVVLGPGAGFVRQMQELVRRPPLSPVSLPFIPVPGSGKNRLQPVWIDDLTTAIVGSLRREEQVQGVYEIGGADAVTLNDLILAFAKASSIQKHLLHIPLPLMFAAASVLEALLPRPPITVDQLLQLRTDNVCDNMAIRDTFGIRPIDFEEMVSRLDFSR